MHSKRPICTQIYLFIPNSERQGNWVRFAIFDGDGQL